MKIFLIWRHLAWLLLLALIPAQAVEVEGLYEADVVVESRAEGRERQQAFARAMREVLVKVAGKRDVLELAPVRRALDDAQSYVESWAYRTVPAEEAGRSEGGEVIELEVTFFQPAILRLLNENNVAVWSTNRPLTLVWLVVQEELGERGILDSSSDHAVKRRLMHEAEERGLPLLFPLMDLEDRRLITAERLWSLDRDAVLEAAERYQAESVLVLRVFRSRGENLARTAYFFRQREQSENYYDASLETVLARPLDMVAEELSDYYGVLLSGIGQVRVVMTVEGIDEPRDYAALLEYVDGLADVNDYAITRVERDTLNLELSTGGQIRQLVESIALDDDLRPVTDLNRRDNAVYMHYRWND